MRPRRCKILLPSWSINNNAIQYECNIAAVVVAWDLLRTASSCHDCGDDKERHTLNRGLQYLGLQLPSFTSSAPHLHIYSSSTVHPPSFITHWTVAHIIKDKEEEEAIEKIEWLHTTETERNSIKGIVDTEQRHESLHPWLRIRLLTQESGRFAAALRSYDTTFMLFSLYLLVVRDGVLYIT